MIERIKIEYLALGLAFAAMILVPWYLLSRDPDNIPTARPIAITKIKSQEIVVVDALIQKPIFNAARTTLAFRTQQLAEMETVEQEAAVEPNNPLPILVGLISKKRGKAVAIVKNMAGETETLRAGQSLDGWQLVSVGPSQATFDGPSGRQVARLDFTNKAIGGPGNGSSNLENRQPGDNE